MPGRAAAPPGAGRPDAGKGGSALCIDGPLARRHHVRLHGSGPRPIVFSHGFGTDQSVWHPILGALPPDATAILFDLPGAGPLLPDDFDGEQYRSLANFADDLLALLDEVRVGRCVFVGHSMSAMVGVLAAIEDPDRFGKLILLNGSPRYLNDLDYEGGFEPGELESLFDAMAANYQSWVAGFAPLAIASELPEAVADFSAGLLRMRPDVAIRFARMIFNSDVRRVLPALPTPTILIHSRDDIAVPPSVVHYMRDRIRRSELMWIDARGHLPQISAPDAVATALRAHLG